MNLHTFRDRGEEGATLILALLIVTSISLVTTALLGQSFASTRVTVSARQVAATQYAADAAAQYATNQLRVSDRSSGLCSSNTTVTSEDLSNFYPAGVTTVAQNAHIDCAPDAGNSSGVGGTSTPCPATGGCPNASPGTALLTLDQNPDEPGIYVNANAGAVRIRGGIFSNSQIKIAAGGLRNTWCPAVSQGSTTYDCTKTSPKTYVIARGQCLGASGSITFDQVGGSQQCSYTSDNDPRGADPGVTRGGYTPPASYSTPTAPTGPASSSSCTSSTCTPDVQASAGPPVVAAVSCLPGSKFQKVLPGRIVGSSGLAFLNSLTGCANGIIQFTPGTYYFDLPTAWNLPSKVTVVGGSFAPGYNPVTPAGTNGWPSNCSGNSCPADYQDACIAPGASGSGNSTGVQFVMGGSSQFNLNDSSGTGSHFTICASNSTDGPPIALYGLKTSIGSGPNQISASALCAPSGTGTTACALIQTANSPKTTANIVGMTYAPRSTIDLILNNSSTKVFYWGVVAYAIEFGTTGSANLDANLIDVLDAWPSQPGTNRYFLNVYACPVSAASCPAGGATPDLKAAVQVGTDLSGNNLPAGNILVLSWSVRR